MKKPKKKSIIIADDHPIFRQGLAKIIEGADDFVLVGEAGDGARALDLINRLNPDVAVVDISMPSMSGLELVRQLQGKSFRGEIVVLTMYREEEYFNEAFDLGVKGYILKECASSELLQCLRRVAQGDYYVSPVVSGFLANMSRKRDSFVKQTPSVAELTHMERTILRLIAENKTSKEIAEQLNISYRTVQNHRTNICSKLGLEGYNKLLQFAIEHKDLL